MTNFEKYKKPEDAFKAFEKWCEERNNSEWCLLKKCTLDIDCVQCSIKWLYSNDDTQVSDNDYEKLHNYIVED